MQSQQRAIYAWHHVSLELSTLQYETTTILGSVAVARAGNFPVCGHLTTAIQLSALFVPLDLGAQRCTCLCSIVCLLLQRVRRTEQRTASAFFAPRPSEASTAQPRSLAGRSAAPPREDAGNVLRLATTRKWALLGTRQRLSLSFSLYVYLPPTQRLYLSDRCRIPTTYDKGSRHPGSHRPALLGAEVRLECKKPCAGLTSHVG